MRNYPAITGNNVWPCSALMMHIAYAFVSDGGCEAPPTDVDEFEGVLEDFDIDEMSEVGLGVIDDLLATATHPPSFAVEDYAWLEEEGEEGELSWERAPGSPEPSVPASSPARFKADLGEAWDQRKVLEYVRGFISAKQFRESYGTNPEV